MDNDGAYDEWGIAHGYHDVAGTWHDTSPATREHLRAAMGEPPHVEPLWFVDQGTSPELYNRCRIVLEDGTDRGEVDRLPDDLPGGYHRLQPLDGWVETALVIAPRVCLPAQRGWGVAAQVYALWRSEGWGIGDLRDVELLGQEIAARGGASLLLSPLHASAPTLPQETSPYYPSSRRWLNPLLIPVDGPSPIANEAGGLIDRNRVWTAKRRELMARFTRSADGPEWQAWAGAQGAELWRYCTWNALAERLGSNWQLWPAPFRHPDSPDVAALAEEDPAFATTVQFHAWLQWLAQRSLERTATVAGVGLIGDLAVGCSPNGADAWMHQDLMALDVAIGAPPDPFNTQGQSWGLPPFVPSRLRAAHYAPFIDMLRTTCHSMSGLRIDHVMGLFRQFWIPEGGSPADGAYVKLPAKEMLALVRLEATRAGAFVIGEDLGTVEPEVWDALRDGGILGTKVWWFDTNPAQWPEANLATVTTHDLPTVYGVWAHTDGTPEMAAELQSAVVANTPAAASVELHQQIAASAAALCLATVDDLAGMADRPNHPGTLADENPNWCLRMPADAPTILDGSPGHEIIEALRTARPAAH